MSYGVNAPQGLQALRLLSGACWNGQTNPYFIASGYNTSLFTGDPIYVVAGAIILATAGTGNPITGVFQGVVYTDPTGTVQFRPFWLANTVTQNAAPAEAALIVDPYVVYNIQVVNNPAQGIREVDLYRNANLFAGAGNQFSGQSGWGLDQTSIGPEPTKQLKIINLVAVPGNKFDTVAVAFPFNNVEVVINNDYYKGGTGTAAP